MPKLSHQDRETNKTGLEIVFSLTSLVTHGTTTEGWLCYNLVLKRNGDEMAAVSGTVHNNDLIGIENLLENRSARGSEYEPIEPDFKIRVEDNSVERLVTVMINNGFLTNRIYDRAGVGFCIPSTKTECIKFADELRKRRIELTKGLEFKDYEAKELPA